MKLCNTLKNFSEPLLYLVYHVNALGVDNTSNGVLDKATVPLPLLLLLNKSLTS